MSIRENRATVAVARHHVARALRWILVALTLALALVGFQYLTAVRRVQGVGADGSPVAPTEPQFSLSVAMLTGAALTPGNRVEIALEQFRERSWTQRLMESGASLVSRLL